MAKALSPTLRTSCARRDRCAGGGGSASELMTAQTPRRNRPKRGNGRAGRRKLLASPAGETAFERSWSRSISRRLRECARMAPIYAPRASDPHGGCRCPGWRTIRHLWKMRCAGGGQPPEAASARMWRGRSRLRRGRACGGGGAKDFRALPDEERREAQAGPSWACAAKPIDERWREDGGICIAWGGSCFRVSSAGIRSPRAGNYSGGVSPQRQVPLSAFQQSMSRRRRG